MKKILLALLTAAGLAVAARAEGTGTLFGQANYNTYRSSDAISSATGQVVVAGSCILHKVIVSSTAYNVLQSTNAVFQILDGQTSSGRLRAEINLSTQTLPLGPSEYTFDIAMSSGIFTSYQGNVTNGKVTLIYTRAQPGSSNAWKVWTSTYMASVDTNAHNLSYGPVLLHKIIVLTKGTGTAVLGVYDSMATSPSPNKEIAAIDLTDTAREYTYNILCSSGITVQSSGAGTVAPQFLVLYKRNITQDYDVWQSSFTTGSVSLKNITWGSGQIFGGVVNGDSVVGSSITVFNSSGTPTNQITSLDGSLSFDRKMYDVMTSSGITYSSSGAGLYTILYKRH